VMRTVSDILNREVVQTEAQRLLRGATRGASEPDVWSVGFSRRRALVAGQRPTIS
jgi:hypothetical protein